MKKMSSNMILYRNNKKQDVGRRELISLGPEIYIGYLQKNCFDIA